MMYNVKVSAQDKREPTDIKILPNRLAESLAVAMPTRSCKRKTVRIPALMASTLAFGILLERKFFCFGNSG